MKKDYYKEMLEDIMNYLSEYEIKVTEETKEEVYEKLYDEMWVEDSITGNGSGSYTFSRLEAMNNVGDNLPLFFEACEEFGIDAKEMGRKVKGDEWEWCDVTIRCYLLSSVLSDALDEIINANDALANYNDEKNVFDYLVNHEN